MGATGERRKCEEISRKALFDFVHLTTDSVTARLCCTSRDFVTFNDLNNKWGGARATEFRWGFYVTGVGLYTGREVGLRGPWELLRVGCENSVLIKRCFGEGDGIFYGECDLSLREGGGEAGEGHFDGSVASFDRFCEHWLAQDAVYSGCR